MQTVKQKILDGLSLFLMAKIMRMMEEGGNRYQVHSKKDNTKDTMNSILEKKKKQSIDI